MDKVSTDFCDNVVDAFTRAPNLARSYCKNLNVVRIIIQLFEPFGSVLKCHHSVNYPQQSFKNIKPTFLIITGSVEKST